MVSRRTFLRVTGASVLTLFVTDLTGTVRALSSTLVATLDPSTLPQFVTPLTIPGQMPKVRRIPARTGKAIDYYEISVRQFRQQVLPAGWPSTTVWGFGPAWSKSSHHAPSLTIEAEQGRPVRVKWINSLVDHRGRYLPHLLPVDPTLHWANPGRRPGPDGVAGTDLRPDFTGLTYRPPAEFSDPATEYTDYLGPVPFITHVHGAMHVADHSDGYPEAWFLPAARNLPADHARVGGWYRYLARRARRDGLPGWGAGYSVSQYPVANRASALWYHDHTLGMTRLNVYAGPAGFFLVRGGPGGESAVLDSRTGGPAVLPGPRPTSADRPGKAYREIPIVIQDRTFTASGQLFYPGSREHFDGFSGPFIPDTQVSPVWNPEFFGDTLVVNGSTWPFLQVEQARYRLRLLNGCQSRFLILDFAALPGVSACQIGNDGGLLPAVHPLTGPDALLLLAPAERADVIIDFTDAPLGEHVLTNVGPDEPYGGGEPDVDFDVANPATTGRVLAFRVVPATRPDPSTPGDALVLPAIPPPPGEVRTRKVALLEHAHEMTDGQAPTAAMLGVVTERDEGAHLMPMMWSDPITENPAPGDTELWEIYNGTADAHPVHVHEVAFEVVGRRPIEVMDGHVFEFPGAELSPPLPGETGRKDTVIAYPDQVTVLRISFTTPGQYVWHCHIVEHEDNEMMRPFRIGPQDPAQPGL